MDLDTAHLRSFLAIVRYGGYHRAADALHLTQPAVSRHMRRLEAQLGEPLFAKLGRGVELTAYGERAAAELAGVLAAHDGALARLQRGAGEGPFVLGAIENLVDPVLPDLIAVVREQLGERPLQLRIDRSLALVDRVAAGEVDAAIVGDPGDAPDPLPLGTIPLRWWASPARAAGTLPSPLPLVAYDAPCALRERAIRRLDELGLEYVITSESPHLSGVHAAVRNGLGYALLVAGGDGLRGVAGDGPLSGTLPTGLWLLLTPAERALAVPLRAALWRATTRRALPSAA